MNVPFLEKIKYVFFKGRGVRGTVGSRSRFPLKLNFKKDNINITIENSKTNKMPKYTRDQLFQTSFHRFMASFIDTYCEDLTVWRLTCLTENKTSSVHTYSFEVPKQISIGRVDTAFVDQNGVQQEPGGELLIDQEMPSVECFSDVFTNHYVHYELEQNGRVLSYTSLNNCSLNAEGNFDATIEVCYYKSYIPYPSNIQSREQLEQQCRQLKISNHNLRFDLDNAFDSLRNKNKKISNLKKTLRVHEEQSNERLANTIYRMQERIRDLYAIVGKEEECPVCYEEMHPNELVVPGCCHYICARCNQSCDKCPLCREEYVMA